MWFAVQPWAHMALMTALDTFHTHQGPWHLWYFVKAMNTHQLLLRVSLSSEQSERLGHPFAIESPSSLWSPSELLSFMPRTTNCSIYNDTRTEHSEDKLARNLSHLKVPRKHLCALEFPSSLRLIPVSTLHTDRACLWSFNANILLCSLCLTNISVLTCTSEALSSEQSNALVNHAYALESASSLWSRSSLWSVRHTSQYAHISICFHTGICFPTGCDVKHGTGNIPSIVRIPPWQRGEFLLGVAPGHLLYVLPDPYVYALESSSSLWSPSSRWSLLVFPWAL